jgi:site-specific recombinase XerD
LSYQFGSSLKAYIIAFLKEKRELGYSYKSGESILKQFDRFCIEYYPDANTVTPELGLAWSVRRKDEKGSSFEGRICTVRELARYMIRCGIDAFVIPKGMGCGGSRFVPHIFTDEELIRFFERLDKMEISTASPIQHIVYPVLFRLLYSTGLRPIEAVKLSCQNVDLLNNPRVIKTET